MADITWNDVVKIAPAPELAGSAVPIEAQTEILRFVNREALNVRIFGGEDSSKYKLARVFLAAHFGSLQAQATMGGSSGTTGMITSESEGGLSRSYSQVSDVPGADDTSWGASVYGQKYAAITRTTLSRLPFIAGRRYR